MSDDQTYRVWLGTGAPPEDAPTVIFEPPDLSLGTGEVTQAWLYEPAYGDEGEDLIVAVLKAPVENQ